MQAYVVPEKRVAWRYARPNSGEFRPAIKALPFGKEILIDVTPADFEHVFGTNTRGAFFVAQEVAKRMIMRGNDTYNPAYRIINIASMAGLRVLPQIGLYSVSKAAVVHMTRTMALDIFLGPFLLSPQKFSGYILWLLFRGYFLCARRAEISPHEKLEN